MTNPKQTSRFAKGETRRRLVVCVARRRGCGARLRGSCRTHCRCRYRLPTSAIQARPAPIIFAAASSIRTIPLLSVVVVKMQCFVQVNASEDCEYVCLQERDKELGAMMQRSETSALLRGHSNIPPAPPSATTNPANTWSIVWPASMFANRRTDRLIGGLRTK